MVKNLMIIIWNYKIIFASQNKIKVLFLVHLLFSLTKLVSAYFEPNQLSLYRFRTIKLKESNQRTKTKREFCLVYPSIPKKVLDCLLMGRLH